MVEFTSDQYRLPLGGNCAGVPQSPAMHGKGEGACRSVWTVGMALADVGAIATLAV